MTTKLQSKIIPPDGGTWIGWLGNKVQYFAGGSETNQSFTFSRGSVSVGHGPPPHRHTFEEGFYVKKGNITFTAGNRSVEIPTGGFINISGKTPHYLKNTGDIEAEVLVITAPAGFDEFQKQAGKILSGQNDNSSPLQESDLQRMKDLAPKFGIELDLPEQSFQVTPEITVKLPGEGNRIAVVGDVYTFLAVSENTNGKYAFWHALIYPGGGPPPHIHHREEEAFYVLKGQISFFAEGKKIQGGRGTFVNLPRDGLHAFKNESDTLAEMLILVAPGGVEKMFSQVGKPWPDANQPPPPPSQEEIHHLLEIAPNYGVEIKVPDH